VFDREAEGECYASLRKQISTETNVNIIGQPQLHIEPQVRCCPSYNHFIMDDVRVCQIFVLTGIEVDSADESI